MQTVIPPQHDESFDGKAHKFCTNIYASTKGKIRTAIVQEALARQLAQCPAKRLRILDAGGGFGYFSVPLAAQGQEVVLCDLSHEMLSLAKERAAVAGASANMTFIQGALQDLSLDLGHFDVVLCHAVLEWLADPRQAIAHLAAFLGSQGQLSLLVYNYYGLLYQSLIVGNFDYVARGLQQKKQAKLTPTHPQKPEDIRQWLHECGLRVQDYVGVRVIHDFMRHKTDQTDKFEALLAMEQQFCRTEPFVGLGRYLYFAAAK